MSKTSTFLALVAAPLMASSAHAVSELELAVSADVVGLEYSQRDEDRGSEWSAGAMYNNDINASLLTAAFNVVGEASANGQLFTGLGFKAALHDTFQTAGSLALGGFAQFAPAEFQGLGLEGRFYYAPEILNSNDADQFYDLAVRLTYMVHPQAKVFVGWSNVSVGYDHELVDDVDIEQAFNLGFSLLF